MIRVAVVDNEPLIRSGITHALSAAEDIQVTTQTAVPDALKTVQDDPPDIVLIDCSIAEAVELCAGWELLDRPRVCALSSSSQEEDVTFALASGSAGYILKNTAPERLPLLVRFLSEGWTVTSPEVGHSVMTSFHHEYLRHTSTAPIDRLTDRERAVLVLLACGLSNGEIGTRIHLSLGTVKDHVRSILSKLGVPNRLQAAVLADRAGLMAPQLAATHHTTAARQRGHITGGS
ncbi:LuxR C-terminal-related transcriptional regulator [Streptomyces sp. NPDC059456]|uniref:LuxR C-terminal-related transcriptional regulator n=1 Tax=Streptomyces sp. NPDC059456 TaxID=3346838 RepID=UPI0036846E5F